MYHSVTLYRVSFKVVYDVNLKSCFIEEKRLQKSVLIKVKSILYMCVSNSLYFHILFGCKIKYIAMFCH